MIVCTKHISDPFECIDCATPCPQGSEMVNKLERETRKTMTLKEQHTIQQKISAMSNYIEAMATADPASFVFQKYGCKNERVAKNKIYQWQHNYGTNLRAVSEKINELQANLEAAQTQMKNESSNKDEVVKPTVEPAPSKQETRITKRQEEKISQNHLSTMRNELEAQYLQAEKDIEDHKKAIVECEKKMEEISEQIKALMKVLDIFKEKDKYYV